MSIFRIPASADHVRTIKDPNQTKTRILHALVKVNDLPEDIPLDPDPRVPKVKGPVTRRITESLRKNDGRFHLLNRGITLSVKKVDFDNQLNRLILNIPNDEMYGIIDGGHTYKAVTSVVKDEGDKEKANGEAESDDEKSKVLANQFVHLEIMEGIELHLADIAEARNFSIALKAWSLANYRKDFEWFLEALGNDYKKYIKVSENDEEPVGILDLIQVMCAVNPILFPATSAPIDAYNNARRCLDVFIARTEENPDPNGFRQLAPVAQDIIRLNDHIRFNWKRAYNSEDETGRRGRLGARAEVNLRKRNRTALATYYFLDPKKGPIQGDEPIEKSLSLPLISGFRALLEEKNGKLEWATDPFEFFGKHGSGLVKIVMGASESKGGDPHAVGRDPQVYNYLYTSVSNSYLSDKFLRNK